MSEIREVLRESSREDIVEGYIGFKEIENQNDNLEDQSILSYEELTNLVSYLEQEINDRDPQTDFENFNELLEGKRNDLNYDPVKRTKWFINNTINADVDDELKDYWHVYTNFLKGFRESKIDLKQYN